MELSDFRSEFFSQLIQMRGAILDNLTPKMLAGRPVDGAAIATMVEQFVKAINDGIVPDIQNTWQFVIQTENQKHLERALQDYEECIQDCIAQKFPMTQDEVLSIHQTARKQASAAFKKNAYPEAMSLYLNTFKKSVANSLQKIQYENQKQSQQLCQQFISQEFSYIDSKLKSKKYATYNEFENDVKLFMHFYDENCTEVINKHIYLLDYLLKVNSDAAKFFIQDLAFETQTQRKLNADLQAKFTATSQNEKEEHLKEQNKILEQLAQLKAEKAEFNAKEAYYQQDIAQLKSDKEAIFNQINLQLSIEKEQKANKISEMEQKIRTQDEEIKRLERQLLFNDSEKDKDNALLQQQKKYYEKIIEELNKKEKDLLNQINQKQYEHSLQIKEISQKYEQQIKQQTEIISELKEKVQDLESDFQQNNEKFFQERSKFEIDVKQLNFELGCKKEQIAQLKLNLSNIETNDRLNDSSFQYESQQQLVTLESKNQSLEQQLKQKEEEFRGMKSKSEKEQAIQCQKIEFLEMQLKDVRMQMTENNRAHEAILKAFESSQTLGQRTIDQKTFMEMKEKYESELQQLQREFHLLQQSKQMEIGRLKEGFDESKNELAEENRKLAVELAELKDEASINEEIKCKQQEQLKQQEETKLRLLNEYEQQYLSKTRQLEDALETLKQTHSVELQQLQQQSEEQLTQLKNFYQLERERLEKRMQEERDRMLQKQQHLLEDTEGQWTEERLKLYEELEITRQDLRDKENEFAQLEIQSSHQMQLWGQKVTALEKFLEDTRSSFQQSQRAFAEEREQWRVQASEERKQAIERTDSLLQENGKKEREIIKMEQELRQLSNEIAQKEQQINAFTEDSNTRRLKERTEIAELTQQIDDLKKVMIEKRIEAEREKALLLQERTFSEQKIEELQNKLGEVSKAIDERVRQQRIEIYNELESSSQKWKEEKKSMEEKLEALRREKKELIKFSKQSDDELKQLRSYKEQYEKQMDSLRCEWEIKSQLSEGERQTLLSNWQEECRQLQFEMDRLKQENFELDASKTEIMTNYERDQLLWESKFKFLEKQKDEAKSDWADSIKKFELTLQHMKKARQTDREDHEGQLNEILQTIEKKHSNEIQDLNETHQRIISELQERIKGHEREIKHLNDKIQQNQGKYGTNISMEIKVNEMIEREKKYKAEIEKLKEDRDLKYNEYARFIEQERENWRTKVSDVDSKYKLVESKRTQMIYDFEKEKAKWNLQKDHQDAQLKEQQDSYEKLFKKYQQQAKELEKLRNESRVSRRSINLMGVNQTNESINTSTINLTPGINFKDVVGKANLYNNQSDLMSEQPSQFTISKATSKYDMQKKQGTSGISWQQINQKKESKYY